MSETLKEMHARHDAELARMTAAGAPSYASLEAEVARLRAEVERLTVAGAEYCAKTDAHVERLMAERDAALRERDGARALLDQWMTAARLSAEYCDALRSRLEEARGVVVDLSWAEGAHPCWCYDGPRPPESQHDEECRRAAAFLAEGSR